MINIIIVEDLPLVLEGIKVLLSQDKEFNILKTYSKGQNLLDELKIYEENLDVLLLDIEMPEMNGIELTKKVLSHNKSIKILALSMHDELEYYTQMMSAGAKGFVLKQRHYKELRDAILKVHEGEYYFSGEILQQLITRINHPEDKELNSVKLNEREMHVIKYISKGLLTKEIASQMHLSVRSIENIKSRLMTKTETNNNASLLMWSLRNRIISLD